MVAGLAPLIRIDAIWLSAEPLDMRAGADKALTRVIEVFGHAKSHHAYLFVNRRASRLKVIVHDGFGIWLAARRLHQGGFVWPRKELDETLSLTPRQLDALVIGLPWHRLEQAQTITLI